MIPGMQAFHSRLKTSVLLGAAVLCAATTFSAVLRAQATPFGPSVWDGVFSTAQADRGRNLFSEHCASCHGGRLEGGEGPSLVGDKFWSDWKESTVGALLSYVSKNMPFDGDGGTPAGSLPANTYSDIVAHILNSNGFPSGTTDLSATTAVGIQIITREGPGELPASTLARVVGCLEKVGSTFQLVRGSRPVRAGSGLPPANTVALSDRTVPLKFLVLPLDRYVGQKMAATGLLLGEGGRDGMNVETVVPVSQQCQ
jgi:mono/diheme cytochrome c family protein